MRYHRQNWVNATSVALSDDQYATTASGADGSGFTLALGRAGAGGHCSTVCFCRGSKCHLRRGWIAFRES